MKKVVFSSTSPAETKAFGKRLGALLIGGDVVALVGGLGFGKTCLAQGIAQGLGVSSDSYVRSPSFIIMNIYEGRIPMYHIDLYRLDEGDGAVDLDIDEYLYGEGAAIVEWADRESRFLRDATLRIEFYYEDDLKRRLELTGEGKRGVELLWAL